jgi:hypothetical protein
MLAEDSFVQQYLQRASKLNEENNAEDLFLNEVKKANSFNKRAVKLLKDADKVK